MSTVTEMSAVSANQAMVLFDHVAGLFHKVHLVSLTRSSSTATAIATDHQFTTGSTVTVAGADQADYNGNFVVTVVDKDTFTYTVANSPVTPATGDITAADPNLSRVATGCTVVQVETPPAGTTLKIEKRVHPQATWLQEGTDLTSASATTIVAYPTPIGFVRVRRSAGTGNCKAFAQRA